MNTYDEQIIYILAKAGKRGMSVKKISMQLYNLNCTLFSVPDFGDMYKYVRNFILRNSKLSQPLFCKTNERGLYRLNTGSSMGRQLMINFAQQNEENESIEEKNREETKNDTPDLSLSLFDEFS